MSKINNVLKARIIEHYGTQADFAAVIKMDESLVSRITRGRRLLDEEGQQYWAALLKSDAKELFKA